MDIPIENIYYLLCYAWNKLEEKDIVKVKTSDSTSILNLFSRVLISGLTHLFKRGIDREYVNHRFDIKGIKGKINFNDSIKRNLFSYCKANCEYDELDNNVLHNKIIKATIFDLLKAKEIENEYIEELLIFFNRFKDIDNINISDNDFSRVRLHRNNYFYDFLLKICQLIKDNLLVSEERGESKFKNFLQDEKKMNLVFEEFLRNFFRLEQKKYKVSRENISWNFQTFDYESYNYLPIMQTDISLESEIKKIIIEAKYYKETLKIHYDREKINSSNLYQLSAYLGNIELKGGLNKNCEGILVYPTVDKSLNLKYKIGEHILKIKTINLNQPWQDIHNDLINIVN